MGLNNNENKILEMIEMNLPLEEISKETGLSVQDVVEIKNRNLVLNMLAFNTPISEISALTGLSEDAIKSYRE